MNEIKEWWNQASTRDQLSLVVCGGVLMLYLLYVAMLRPVIGMRDDQVRKNLSQMEALERVRELAAVVVNQNSSSEKNDNRGSIVEVVDQSLRKHNLKLSGMQPSGNSDVRIRLEQVPFDNLLAWLYEVEVSQGMQIKDISVATGASTGLVSVNMRLHRE